MSFTNKFLLVFGVGFFIFSSLFLSPMFVMGIILMPLTIQAMVMLLLPIAYGAVSKKAYTRE